VLNDIANTYPSACANLKNRGIIISVLYIPYQKIWPVIPRLPVTKTITPTTTSRIFRPAFRPAHRRISSLRQTRLRTSPRR
jgi:hypothetical protein